MGGSGGLRSSETALMSQRIIIRAKAKLDIAEAAVWYRSKRDGLGDEFLAAVGRRIDYVLANSKTFQVVARKVIRRALVDRFPYAIYFGWLSSILPTYPSTLHLKTHVHTRPIGIRPLIELEPTDHPLAREQRMGITWERVLEINRAALHPTA